MWKKVEHQNPYMLAIESMTCDESSHSCLERVHYENSDGALEPWWWHISHFEPERSKTFVARTLI